MLTETLYKKTTELTHQMDELQYFIGATIDQKRCDEVKIIQTIINTIEQIESDLNVLKSEVIEC